MQRVGGVGSEEGGAEGGGWLVQRRGVQRGGLVGSGCRGWGCRVGAAVAQVQGRCKGAGPGGPGVPEQPWLACESEV